MNEVETLTPVGAVLHGIPAAQTGADALQALLAEHGVLVLPDQHLDDEQFTSWLQRFGPLMFTVGETPVPGHPDLNVISNVGRTTPPRSVFHVDTSYVSAPPPFTALRAVSIPESGGQTEFTNQYRAYETLPAAIRDRLQGRTIRHLVTGVDPGTEQETEADHPAFRVHPVSGRTSLYLSTPQRCVSVSGLPDDEGRELIESLYAHSTRADNVYRHAWRAHDLVIWDNRCVLHRADHSGVVGDRVMHRGMVAERATVAS